MDQYHQRIMFPLVSLVVASCHVYSEAPFVLRLISSSPTKTMDISFHKATDMHEWKELIMRQIEFSQEEQHLATAQEILTACTVAQHPIILSTTPTPRLYDLLNHPNPDAQQTFDAFLNEHRTTRTVPNGCWELYHAWVQCEAQRQQLQGPSTLFNIDLTSRKPLKVDDTHSLGLLPPSMTSFLSTIRPYLTSYTSSVVLNNLSMDTALWTLS